MKKVIITNFLLGAMLMSSMTLSASPKAWSNFSGKYAPSSMEMTVSPTEYKIFTLKNEEMKNFLFEISENIHEAQEIVIPTPDGKNRTFRIWKTPIMANELQAQYADIQTFTGDEVGNPGVTIKIGYTTYGFSAQVYDGDNTYIIDPYSNAKDGYYMAFYKRHLAKEVLSCNVGAPTESDFGIADLINNSNNQLKFADPTFDESRSTNNNQTELTHGAQNRKLRTAITTTGEWSVGITGTANPTRADVFSKVVEIINRTNGYFEREIAVTLELVNGADMLVYLNKDTDPYTCNNNMDCLLDESHTAINNRIGLSNYDIGHILCTAGGGLAALNSTCSNNSKGRAASTVYSTAAVSTLMHEMGHQMSASHTFSANTGGCNGNGMPDGAYEPGSGSTIMSYSGACAPNNVLEMGDDYYHVHTLTQIATFLSAATCGTLTTNIPVLTIRDQRDSFYIPRNTPFELVGPTASVQGSQIPQTFYYNWEQYDIGFDLVEADGATRTDGPTFRSHNPKLSPTQSYPPTSEIIEGNYSLPGYRLPNVSRDINFKFTARGILNARGTFNTTDNFTTIKSVASAGPFRVTSNNVATTTSVWNPGQVVRITWDTANTKSAPINCNGVSIFLHYPDGSRSDIQIVGYAPNTGTFSYTVPNYFAEEAHIKIKGAGNVFFDLSKGKVRVTGTSVNDLGFENDLNIFPNPASDIVNIKYDNTNNLSDIKVVMYNAMGQQVYTGQMRNELSINTATFAAGNYFINLIDANTGKTATKKVIVNR